MIAPGAKVALAAIVVPRRPSSPARPIVSTIEKPQGDQAPVSPITSAAATRLSSRALIAYSSPRSAWDVGLVVLDTEDLAPAEAVAGERSVPVDPRAVVRTAVPEL